MSWNTATNYIGCFSGGAFDPCGDYASDSLTPEICTTCCGRAGYQYSALKKGEQCWCSDSVAFDSGVGDPWCDEPCTGNIVLRCGGQEAYSVYAALGTYNFSLELTMPANISVYERITAEISSFPGALNTLDFGEDVEFDTWNTSVSYLYHSHGQHIVYGHALLGEYGEAQIKSTLVAVSCPACCFENTSKVQFFKFPFLFKIRGCFPSHLFLSLLLSSLFFSLGFRVLFS